LEKIYILGKEDFQNAAFSTESIKALTKTISDTEDTLCGDEAAVLISKAYALRAHFLSLLSYFMIT
jgi:hypothetical protein